MDSLLGASEANIRRIFSNPPRVPDTADDGARRADEESALHVVVFDEFDAIAAPRTEAASEGSKATNSVNSIPP